jgi:Zn-dependent protease/Tfp pilus assembly protein PilF
MKWSLLVGRFWGTEIRLHVTLLLLVPYVLLTFRPEGAGETLQLMLLIAATFACVVLHEMGHTLAAKAYGIQVKSIVLWPLGGFANLSRRPENVWHDAIISAAGPLANLLLACLLAIITLAERLLETSQVSPGLTRSLWQIQAFPFLVGLLIANLALALFNLLPVYPLDGGQIARSLLKLVVGEKRADGLMILFSLPLALALTAYGLANGDVVTSLTGVLLMLGSSTLSTRLLNWAVLGGLYVMDRAGFYLRRQDLDSALAEYTRAIDRNPDSPGLYVNRAIASMNLMDLLHARADVERALALDQSSFIAWALLGELLSLDKSYEQALDAYNRAIMLKPNWAIAFLDRGSAYQLMGDLDRALADMNHAVGLGNNTPVAYLLRSILRHQMGDKEGALADAGQVQRFAPQWMLVFPEIFLLNFKDHLEWVGAYYDRAVEQMPGAYQSFQGRADAYRVNNRPGWAIADYDRAIQLAPRQAELYLGRGRAYLQMTMPDSAAQDFRQAAALAEFTHIRRQAEDLLRSL